MGLDFISSIKLAQNITEATNQIETHKKLASCKAIHVLHNCSSLFVRLQSSTQKIMFMGRPSN